MEQIDNWSWIETQVAQTIETWKASTSPLALGGQRYTPKEQQKREQAYDEALHAIEDDVSCACRTKAERLATQDKVVASFARFSATALDLKDDTIRLLTDEFLPVGTKLARWARRFDPSLGMAEIIQACRNAWTACGLQPLLGVPVGITPSILGYSLLYPYSDNYLDQAEISPQAKLHFSERFRCMLRGENIQLANHRESALCALIALIEREYPRTRYPQVFDCLLAIHRAQEDSIKQLADQSHRDDAEVLRLSCAKGGSSVVADACLAYGRMTEEESRFAFEWGVLLQLGDDLQDIHEDIRRGSATLFSRAATSGMPLDRLAMQLLNFSDKVGERMDQLPHGTPELKDLLKMSWRSLIIRAVADSHEFFSDAFLHEAERCSPFRFGFLRLRRNRLAGRQGLYAMLFDAFLQAREHDETIAIHRTHQHLGTDITAAADVSALV